MQLGIELHSEDKFLLLPIKDIPYYMPLICNWFTSSRKDTQFNMTWPFTMWFLGQQARILQHLLHHPCKSRLAISDTPPEVHHSFSFPYSNGFALVFALATWMSPSTRPTTHFSSVCQYHMKLQTVKNASLHHYRALLTAIALPPTVPSHNLHQAFGHKVQSALS